MSETTREQAENVAAAATLGIGDILTSPDSPEQARGLVLELLDLVGAVNMHMTARLGGRRDDYVAETAAHVGTCLSLVMRVGYVWHIEQTSRANERRATR